MTKSEKKTLKEQNHWLIGLFILWSCSLYAVFLATQVSLFADFPAAFAKLSAKDGIFAAFSPLLAVVLTGLVSSGNKARLIFWRCRDALPGHRAFSRLARNDARIDLPRLRDLVVPWPDTRADENRVWFAIYKKFTNASTVLQAHKAFLLNRDIATIALIFAVVGPLGLCLSGVELQRLTGYVSVMLMQYLIFMIVARNHGNRFVCNVLVEFIASKR